jgi:AcrR family transcriptional regulator
VSENAILPGTGDVAERIAQETLTKRSADRSLEVRRLLDAGLEVMIRCGTDARPRVADIVAAAGLSNDAFYRYFASKDMLTTAILEDGMDRLTSYLAHQMDKEQAPERKLRRWVEGILSQAANEGVATSTLAVLWNASQVGTSGDVTRPSANAHLARLLVEPLGLIGSSDPELDATLLAHAVLGTLTDYLWQRTRPNKNEIEHVVCFCLAAATLLP